MFGCKTVPQVIESTPVQQDQTQSESDKTIARDISTNEGDNFVSSTEEHNTINNDNRQVVIRGDLNITNNNETTINGDVYINKPDGFSFDGLFQ